MGFLIQEIPGIDIRKSGNQILELRIYSVTDLMNHLSNIEQLTDLARFFSETYRKHLIEDKTIYEKLMEDIDAVSELLERIMRIDSGIMEKQNRLRNNLEKKEFEELCSKIKEGESKKFELIEEYMDKLSKLENFKSTPKEFVYRGQKNRKWKLEPAIFRKNEKKQFNYDYKNKEKEFYMLFAEHNHPDFEKQKTIFDKLALMQHYSVPTRLLDWTKNPLVALYFAAETDPENDSDGAVFVHAPQYIYYSNDEIVDIFCNLILNNSKREISLEELRNMEFSGRKIWEIIEQDSIVAFKILEIFSEDVFIRPIMTNERLRVQQGCFSLKGCLYNEKKLFFKRTF
uniref:FRG domain protein n=1 Tax=Methanococcus maripaludis (strain C6 / ATCC BAA-1332) TaxID=444158 RepID=A9A7J9_METM6